MNYFYDIVANWQENNLYEFYEWTDNDALELIKKIPIFKIRHKSFLDIVTNKIKVSLDFLKEIENKTLISNKKEVKKLLYACLFTDNKNAYLMEFDSNGISINRSNLLIDDELNVLEISYSLKETKLEYELISALEINRELRQINEAKKIIKLELSTLYQNSNLDKLKYLYYEYRQEENNDIEDIYKELTNELNKDFNDQILKLYYIIKLSYHKV